MLEQSLRQTPTWGANLRAGYRSHCAALDPPTRLPPLVAGPPQLPYACGGSEGALSNGGGGVKERFRRAQLLQFGSPRPFSLFQSSLLETLAMVLRTCPAAVLSWPLGHFSLAAVRVLLFIALQAVLPALQHHFPIRNGASSLECDARLSVEFTSTVSPPDRKKFIYYLK